jgi:hypothetical protein
MSIQSVRLRIKTLQEKIPGINKAYAQLPKSNIVAADLPLFLNFVREGVNDYDPLGSDDVYITRTYLMWLLVKPVAEGEEGESESSVEPWIDTVSKYFIARPSLSDLAGVQKTILLSDSGPKKMIWPGTPSAPQGVYWGVEFKLQVIEVAPIDYVDYE